MESVARLRHYRGSAQKIRLVADLIRMKPVGKALATLRTTRKGCSSDLLKLVESALANAQQNESGVDADALVVSKIHVDEAGRKPLQRNAMIRRISNYKKRFARPRFMSGPQGRMWLVPRPFCHVTVVLSDEAVARKAAGLKAEAAKPLVKKRQGRVAAAVAAAAHRPGKEDRAVERAHKKVASDEKRAERVEAAEVSHASDKNPRNEKKSKKPTKPESAG
ncbi:MAG: 50S ribosomal protein L22 [Acidobacteria bacterium]|jgi:large subunit ribosomal protein L22|nr:50S ribosomal protein L22 [Acidobacteriota bacterium]